MPRFTSHIEQYRQNARQKADRFSEPSHNVPDQNKSMSPNLSSPPRINGMNSGENPVNQNRIPAAVSAPVTADLESESEAAFMRAQTNWVPNSAASAKNAKLLSAMDMNSSQRSGFSADEEENYESMMHQLEQSRQQNMVVGRGGNIPKDSQQRTSISKANGDIYDRLYAEAAKAKDRAAALKRQVAVDHELTVQSTQFKNSTGYLSYSPSLAHRSVSAGRLESRRRARSNEGGDAESVAPQHEFHLDLYERDLRWAKKRDKKCDQIRNEQELNKETAKLAAHTYKPVLATTPSRQLLHRHGNVEDLFHALYSNKDIYAERAEQLKKRLEESHAETQYGIPKILPKSNAMVQRRRERMSSDFDADMSELAANALSPQDGLSIGFDQQGVDNVSPLSSTPGTPNVRGGKKSLVEHRQQNDHAWSDEHDKQLFDAAVAAMEGAESILARDAEFVPLHTQPQVQEGAEAFSSGPPPTSGSDGTTVLGTPINVRSRGRTPKVFSPNPASAAAAAASENSSGNSLSFSQSGPRGGKRSTSRSPGAFGGGSSDRMKMPSPNYPSGSQRRGGSSVGSGSGRKETQSTTVEDMDMVGPMETDEVVQSPVSPVSFNEASLLHGTEPGRTGRSDASSDGISTQLHDMSTMGSTGAPPGQNNVRSDMGYVEPASDPPRELYLHNYNSGVFSNPHTPSAGSTPVITGSTRESYPISASVSANNTPNRGHGKQSPAAPFGSGVRQRPQSANSGVRGASTRGRTLLRGGGSTCAGPNSSPKGQNTARKRPLSANGRLSGRTSYPPASAMGAPASRSRSSAASVRSSGGVSRCSSVFESLYEQRKNHEFVLEEARKKHTPTLCHVPKLVSASAHRPGTPSSIPPVASAATFRSADNEQEDGSVPRQNKDQFFQRLYDHRLRKADLQQEQFHIMRSKELGRNAGIRASYNNQHHPNVQVDTGVIEPETANRMVQRLGVRDIQKRQERKVMTELHMQQKYVKENKQQYTNKRSDNMAKAHRHTALKEIFECLLYSVYLVKEEEARKKAQEGGSNELDVHGNEIISEVPASQTAQLAKMPKAFQRPTSLNINKVYDEKSSSWYDNSGAEKDENVDSNADAANANAVAKPTTPSSVTGAPAGAESGAKANTKLFDASTRLLDSARARADLLNNSVTQEVVGSILQFVSPKLIGLKEFVDLVEEFMSQRLGPPVNMVLGVPDKAAAGLKKVVMSTEEMRRKDCTGKPVLLARKTTEKIVARKWQPAVDTQQAGDESTADSQADGPVGHGNQSPGCEGITDTGSVSPTVAPPKQTDEEKNLLYRMQKCKY